MDHHPALAFVSHEKWQKRPEEGHLRKTGASLLATRLPFPSARKIRLLFGAFYWVNLFLECSFQPQICQTLK